MNNKESNFLPWGVKMNPLDNGDSMFFLSTTLAPLGVPEVYA